MKKKVLVITAGLHIGGAERVAANISKYAPDDLFEFHYLVFEGHENVYGPEIVKKGGKIISIAPPHQNYLNYFRDIYRLMRDQRYTVVHSHTMFNSGLNILAAWLARVPVRITHSHTTKTETKVSVVQKVYEFLMQRIINNLSTDYFACGVEAGNWLYGKDIFERYGYVIKNGIEAKHFAWSPESRKRIRAKYGLDTAFVVGHTGSLVQVKNQAFLIELMPQILKERPDAVLMLVGGGDEDEYIRLRETAKKHNVKEKVIFTGPVQNVNEYLNAFDVFAFPSKREGTPLSLLEAQANGIPCVVSTNIPSDVFLTNLISVVPLTNKVAWVEKICASKRSAPERYLTEITKRGFDARTAYQPIYHAYSGEAKSSCANVSLSFDDGRSDNTNVIDRLLIPRKIPVTLNITTGYIDGSCSDVDIPTKVPPMKMEDVIRLGQNSLVEIALHGDCHKNSVEDINECRRKLIKWFGYEENYLFGMASPGCGMNQSEFLSEEYDSVRNNLLYLRIGLRNFSKNKIRVFARKLGRVIHLPWLYRIAYQDTLMRFCDGKFIYSVPVMGDISFEQVRSIVEYAISQGANITLMFHSVGGDSENFDQWTWSGKKFERLCNYLCENRDKGYLQVCTTKDLYLKLQN